MNTTEEDGADASMTWPELTQAVKGKWADIFEDLAKPLSQAIANAPLHVPCPVHGGENGYRLFDHFNNTGRGICNTCGPQRSGFETLAWVKGYTFTDAVSEVAQWVRQEVQRPPRAARAPMPVLPKMDPGLAHAKISAVWRSSLPLTGTPAEKYLISRGIWAENLPRTLRAHPGLTYWDPKSRTSLGTFPCLLAPIKDKNGAIVSLHRIYLTPEGYKVDVPEPKRMMSVCGELLGAAIRMHEPETVLGICEGIETGLAVRAISRLPVWAGITAGLMEVMDLPKVVEHVVIWGDLDRSNRGAEAAEAAADRFESQGKTVEICMPQGPIPANKKGVDWLDVLTARGIGGFPAKWRRWRPTTA